MKSRYQLKLESRVRAERDLRAHEALLQAEEAAQAEYRRAEKRARRAGVNDYFQMREEGRPPIADPNARQRAERAFSILVCNDDAKFGCKPATTRTVMKRSGP